MKPIHNVIIQGAGALGAYFVKQFRDADGFSTAVVARGARYERLKRGEFDEMRNLRGLGQLLIGLRIAQGFSQDRKSVV